MAAQILNALYSALILERLSGVSITPEVEQRVLEDVCRRLNAIQKMIQMAETVSKPPVSR